MTVFKEIDWKKEEEEKKRKKEGFLCKTDILAM